MRLLLPSPIRNPEEADALTRQLIDRGRQQLAELRRLAVVVPKDSVKTSVTNICGSAAEIFSVFEATPRKAPLARGFVDYTLGRTVTILRRYQELSSRGIGSARETLEKTESLLAMIDESFREQLARLMNEDVADLDSEIEVLKTRLEIEGESEP